MFSQAKYSACTDTHDKMSDKVKETSAVTRNGISCWMIIPLCVFYVYAEILVNLCMHSHSRSLIKR